jgi:anthranilate 1,2-dioxygenase large subunit
MSLSELIEAKEFRSVGYDIFHSPEIYEQERRLIFNRAWCYLCLEAELPNPGSFLRTEVGDIQVLVNRTEKGEIAAFENRCMHRGTTLRRELRGTDTSHTCVYHQWCYSLEGGLTGVPFARGNRGKGGLPQDFDKSTITLRRMRVEIFQGVVFGTFDLDAEPLEQYLGPTVTKEIRDLLPKPVKILGYQRQRIMGNWKLYCENVRDTNHGGLLHMFHATFGLARNSHAGGAKMDDKHRHNISYTTMGSDRMEDSVAGYEQSKKIFQTQFKLRDTSMLAYHHELPHPESLSILSVFPNAVFQQISNSLCTRQIRLRGVDEMELYWTYYGFEDDTEEMVEHRRNQANLVGPGGLVSMEDGEAVQLVHDQTKAALSERSRLLIGEPGPIRNQETMVTEVPVRGFWSYYYEVMRTNLPASAGEGT